MIGPEDSVKLIANVAADAGMEALLVVRAYSSVEEAIAVARDLDSVCDLLLFTGLAPFITASRAGGFRGALDYIPHSALDLYRTLVGFLQTSDGRVPSLSIDTIERSVIGVAFEDIGLPFNGAQIPLDRPYNPNGLADPAAIVEAHVSEYESGRVEACFTCIREVHDQLRALGVKSWRVEHTRSSIAEALRRSELAMALAQSRSNQLAVGLVEVDQPEAKAADAHDSQRHKLQVHEAMLSYAERMHGSLALISDHLFKIHTTRGVVENALGRMLNGYGSPVVPNDLAEVTAVGYGLGGSSVAAERQARYALELARTDGDLRVVYPEGRVIVGRRDKKRQEDQHNLTNAIGTTAAFGLGPLAIARLLEAIRKVNPLEVTALDFAAVHGSQERTARRLLDTLVREGVAEVGSESTHKGPGRPRNVYRIDVDGFLSRIGN